MAIGIRLLAKFATPVPEPEILLKETADWVRQNYSDVLTATRQETVEVSPTLFCRLHPAAEEVELTLLDPEHLQVSASTSSAGPGYHIFLSSLLKSWAQRFQAEWVKPTDEEEGDETGYFFTSNVQQVYAEMTLWLQRIAKAFFDGTLDSYDSGVAIGMAVNAHFESNQTAVTSLGPRSREWLLQTSQDGAHGKDFFAWWNPELDAQYYLRRALCLMWTTVRWRQPASEAEENVLKTVAVSLRRAHELDSTLDYPWVEWRQILELLDSEGPEKEMVFSHASGTPQIGYRRGHVTVNLTGGWRIRIPGSFSEFEFDENNDFYALDPPRELWFTSFRYAKPLTNEQFEKTKQKLKEGAPNHAEESDQFAASATIAKRSRETGEEFFVMNTVNETKASKAVLTIIYSQPHEEEWAVEVWKSLMPPAPPANSKDQVDPQANSDQKPEQV